MINKKNETINKSSSQQLKKVSRLQLLQDTHIKKNHQSPLLKLFINSPKFNNSKNANSQINFKKNSSPKNQ